MTVASNRIRPPLHRELRAMDAALDGERLDDDVATAGEFPRIQRCWRIHQSEA
jgi:hypothetical protein